MKKIKISQADIWFSKCIRLKENHTCQKCGIQKPPTGTQGSDGLECSHNFSRRHRTIRWCVDNALCLCSSCHRWFGENPLDSGVWLLVKLGKGCIKILREKRDSGIKVSKIEEKEITAHYRKEYKRMDREQKRDLVSFQ